MSNLLFEIKELLEKSNPKLLYHYNTKPLDCLYTLRKQDELGIKKLDSETLNLKNSFIYDKFPYIDHVSLFLDPIPLDLVRKHFTKNKIYQSNTVIYEHQIEIQQLQTNLKYYMLVENPIGVFMAEHFWIDADIVKPVYFGVRKFLNLISNYNGSNYTNLIKIISKFKGRTAKAFEDLVNSDRFTEDHKSMYAPTVPHLFIYPIDGKLSVSKIEKKYFSI